MTGPPVEFLGGLAYGKKVFAEQIFAATAVRGISSQIFNGQQWPCVAGPTHGQNPITIVAPQANRLRTHPVPMIQGTHITSLGIQVNGADATVNARVAIYTNKLYTSWYPFQLLVETGDIVMSPSQGYRGVDVDFFIPRTDLYWFAINFSSVGTLTTRNLSNNDYANLLGHNFADSQAGAYNAFDVGSAFGLFPQVYPSGASIGAGSNNHGWMRISP